MKKKIYRIRDKETGNFISLGYKSKTTWLSYPSEAISIAKEFSNFDISIHEIVVFEYKESYVLSL